jgi:hypothetical protein
MSTELGKKCAPRAGEGASRRISQANTGEVVRASTTTPSEKAASADVGARVVPDDIYVYKTKSYAVTPARIEVTRIVRL